MKYELVCTECSKEYSESSKIYFCKCGGKLEVRINIDKIDLTIKDLKKREMRNETVISKYFEFLPLLDKTKILSLGEGYTKLIKSKRLAEKLGLKNLCLKDETTNPTGSFKDRPIVVGVCKALEFDAKLLASASSGNAASSMSACAAKAGISCVALVPENTPSSKLAQLQIYGARVIRVSKPKDFIGDPTVKLLREGCEKFHWHPVPSFGHLNPYQLEGTKTLAYELAEQILPDHVVIPVGGAGLFVGNYRGFKEYKKLGFINSIPKLHAVQAEGCSPFVRAFQTGKLEVWEKPNTIASGLADPYPWDGNEGLKALSETNGTAIAVSDAQIMNAEKMLAKYEGIFAEPSGAASLAGLLKLVEEGIIAKNDLVVCEITGSGFKDLGVVERELKGVPIIKPKLEAVEKILSS